MHVVSRTTVVLALAIGVGLSGSALAATTVPGHTGERTDADGNGFPDAGVQVVGNYSEKIEYGDAVCSLRVGYRGDFGNTAFLDSGSITNHYVCKGPEGTQTFTYVIVSADDPRYTGNPEWATWGTWEYTVLTQGGQGNEAYGGNGNLVRRPYTG